jgi:hypothetical protein
MRMNGKASMLAVAVVALLVGCGGGKGSEKSTFNAAAELTKVKAVHATLTTAHDDLDKARTALSAFHAKTKLNASEEAEKAQLESRLKQAQSAFDAAYNDDQRALTDFLNVALNDMPNAPETREGLKLYSDEAVRNARDFIANSGDYGKALDLLHTAEGYFEAVSAPVPDDLKHEIDTATAMRYLAKDRFDKVKKGMTEDEVRAVTGTPFYANVREHEVRGQKITTWLFNRDDGAVAAIYFEHGQVYAVSWDVKEQR